MTSKLSERAMLVSLHIGSWQGTMLDRVVTDAVNESYKADKEAGRYNKRLVASKFLKGISSAHSNARSVHKLLTLPWEDDGTRALCSVGFLNYQKLMKEAKHKVDAEVRQLPESRSDIIAEARGRLGKMFDVDDYPSEDDIASKFSFDVEIKPMPDAGDFRVELSEENVKSITKDIERRTNQRLEAAMNDVFGRITEVTQKMSERLREYQPAGDGKKAGNIIRDSLVYNINELAELLPALNVTNDPRIEQLRKQMVDDLVEHSPEILRADSKIRAQTISKADKLLKKVQSYMK